MSVFSSPADIVMNYKAKSMLTVPRITEKYNLYPNEIVERIRSDMFIDFDYGQANTSKDEDEQYNANDDFRPHLFLEQHTWLDLDDDGYAEPYILNIHYDTKKVVRVYPRFKEQDIVYNNKKISKINGKRHYTKFSFMPSPDGSIYDWGFGSMLGPINHVVNTNINQLIDAGTQSNCQGGFLGNGINLGRGRGGGPVRLKINEWLPVPHSGDDLRKNIFPLPTKEPSGVLFNLLGFMVNAGEKLSSVTELLMGEQTIHNEPATTSLARIEQGMKVFSAIHKRLHRSFGEEFKMLYALNAEYLDFEYYYRVLDKPEVTEQVFRQDYDKSTCDVIPVSSPEDVSNTQKLVKAQALMGVRGMGLNDNEILRLYVEALQIPDSQAIMQAQQPPPDPKVVLDSEKLGLERDKFEFEMVKFRYEMAKIKSEIVLNLANAESKEIGTQLDQYMAETDRMLASIQKDKKETEGANNTG
jgi:chaperonin GroES